MPPLPDTTATLAPRKPHAATERPNPAQATSASVLVIGGMMFLVPALGVPSELMLQDTLKSALVALGVLLAALVFFWQQRQRTLPLRWHGLVWLPLVLMTYALGSMAWSHTYLAGVEAIRWFILALLLWLGLNTLTRSNLPTLLWGIHGGAVVASVWVTLQFWFDWQFFPQGAVPASSFINRNFFAEYAISVLPLSVWLLTSLRTPRGAALMAASLALNVVALMMTGTRSALLALLVLLPVFVVIVSKYRDLMPFWRLALINKALAAILFIVCVGSLGSIPTQNTQLIREGSGTTALERSFVRTASMAKPSEYTEGSFSIRAQMWMATARMMLANPLTGVGAGAWEVQIPVYQRTYTVLETDYYAHNEFLQLLSEYGMVVGGLVLAFLLAYLLHSAGTTWQLKGADRAEAPLRAFTLVSLLALLIVSNAGFPWHLAACGALLALCLAILAGSDVRLGQQKPFFAGSLHWRPTFSHASLMVVLCSIGLTAYISQQAATTEFKLVRAIKLASMLQTTQLNDAPSLSRLKAELMQTVREGVAINPHYRKLTSEVGDSLTSVGDWENAAWVWKSIASSRPQVAGLWSILALTNSHTGQYASAMQALKEVQRLKPNSLAALTLEVKILSNLGDDDKAIQKLRTSLEKNRFDYDLLQLAYELGYKTHDFTLAIQALELRNREWPEQAADGFIRLGKIYADAAVNDAAQAISAFRSGLGVLPPQERELYRNQVPLPYRNQL